MAYKECTIAFQCFRDLWRTPLQSRLKVRLKVIFIKVIVNQIIYALQNKAFKSLYFDLLPVEKRYYLRWCACLILIGCCSSQWELSWFFQVTKMLLYFEQNLKKTLEKDFVLPVLLQILLFVLSLLRKHGSWAIWFEDNNNG